MTASKNRVARELLEVAPVIIRTIRKKWKRGPICGVTNSQFRVLMFIQRRPGAALQDVARHLGLTSPTTSTIMDELVSGGLVLREPSTEDRRKIKLTLTSQGQITMKEVFDHSREDLAANFTPLTPAELEIVYQALQLLRPLFSTRQEDYMETE